MKPAALLAVAAVVAIASLARAQATLPSARAETNDPAQIAPTAHANPSGPTPDDFGAGRLPPGHPSVGGGAPESSGLPPGHPPVGEGDDSKVTPKELLARLDAMKDELKRRPKSAEIEFALGNLYYENARYPEAIDYYRQLLERAEPPMARWLAARAHPHETLSPEQAGCPATGRPTFDQLIAVADAKAGAKDYAAASTCYEAALFPVIEAETRRANAFFLIGNPDKALELHERVLALEPDFPESQFYLGAILFETGDGHVERLARAKAAWRKFLAEGPDPEREKLVRDNLSKIEIALRNGGHLPDEGGGPLRPGPAFGPIAPEAPAPALGAKERRALEAAVHEGDELLSKRAWEKALSAFDRARHVDSSDARAATGAGVALLNLGRRLDAEAALRSALGRDPNDGTALYELGEVFFENEHYAGAARFWSQLVQSDPATAKKYGVDARLRDAQSRQ
ncbi:MAG: tetratricopeptide repeat protein [Deltaproteobacteria bacterium]